MKVVEIGLTKEELKEKYKQSLIEAGFIDAKK